MAIGDDVLAGLMKVASAGWDGLDNAEESMRRLYERQGAEEDEQRRREAAIVRAALDTPAGAELMAWLMKKTLLRPPSELELSARSAETYAIAKARREGQNGIVFMLLAALAAEPIKEDV